MVAVVELVDTLDCGSSTVIGVRVQVSSVTPTKLNSCRGAGSPEQRVGKHGRNDAYMPCESALPVSVFANRKCRPPRAIQ